MKSKNMLLVLLFLPGTLGAQELKNWQDFRRAKLAAWPKLARQLPLGISPDHDQRWQQLFQSYPIKMGMLYAACRLLLRR